MKYLKKIADGFERTNSFSKLKNEFDSQYGLNQVQSITEDKLLVYNLYSEEYQ